MKYKLLGKSGLRVSELCLGTMTFGQDSASLASTKEEARAVFDAFVESGGNFIDTANRYHMGQSEELVGEFVGSARDRFVIATKYAISMNPEDPNAGGTQRKNLTRSVEASLRRLHTDYIDLLWVHAWDFLTPVEEVMRALDDLVRTGKILYVGVSNVPAWMVARANTLAEWRDWSQFIGLQVQYNLIQRAPERELLPMAAALDIGVTAWSPLGGGVLTGKYNRKEAGNEGRRRFSPDNPRSRDAVNERNLGIAAEVQQVAAEMGKTPAQVALNWIRQRPDKGVIVPIVGARTVEQIKDDLGCLDFELPRELLDRLNAVSQIELGYPYDFVRKGQMNPFFFGNKVIEDHRL